MYGSELPATVKPLVANVKDSFAYVTLKDRLPVILTQLVDTLSRLLHTGFPDSLASVSQPDTRVEDAKSIIAKIGKLRYELQCNKVITPFDSPHWTQAMAEFRNSSTGDKWFDVPWLFSECFMYGNIAHIFRQTKSLWWKMKFDWFGEQKAASFRGSLADIAAVAEHLNRVLSTECSDNQEEEEAQFKEFLHYSLWGNQVDLSMNADRTAEQVAANKHANNAVGSEFILVEETEQVFEYLFNVKTQKSSGVVHFVLDNAGAELFMDLCLAEWLMQRSYCSFVVFHVKSHPWFVSDTTMRDVDWLLQELNNFNADLSQRWNKYRSDGRWKFVANDFWTSFEPFWCWQASAPDLHSSIMNLNTSLVIFKGDLNYRKLVHDASWPFTTSFKDAIGPLADLQMNCPLLTLRTLKADVVVGLTEPQVTALDEKYGKQSGAKGWLVSGKFAVIQTSL